tara:strand:- start:1013 stop:1405 length:393 start_codon:yes stop_codon:yes gene_type:complete
MHRGKRFTVVHCPGALDDLKCLLVNEPEGKRRSLIHGIFVAIKRLSDGQLMTRETFRKEGELPRQTGRSNGHFFCLKKQPIRGYCWLSKKYPTTYYISHYILKRKDKLQKVDTAKVHKNWMLIEDCGDEH